jgi:hypothetical protein
MPASFAQTLDRVHPVTALMIARATTGTISASKESIGILQQDNTEGASVAVAVGKTVC